ncbi:hypothetical protein FVEN_g4790 [Fusarium venenatum]|uniref:Uncharacterized protein n=1 Tax=Fusarium venenatum TaxID=56646 RepID=A0A2L2SMV9_9HYPO|nr:uncharacterized protein FVRRES_11347 [Fusarium venenatum]KAG8357383.1 hypothetical protein FVEN_g4790 [Fusarium venenatum]KAH6978054.1 hypothetical protein EDB82DRAFT_207039 [Fusarium venenatum]CEI38656.1 unnamed protein product [Fusarium venenatum]
MAHNRANHNPEEEFDDTPLSRISGHQLDQLTKLLWMDPGVNVVMPDQKWLQSQYDGVARLDKSNRRSKNIWKRLSSGLENMSLTPRHVNDGRPTACLCDFHRDLDPKLIRRLMGLITAECTVRIHRYREWRRRNTLPTLLTHWLDRIDAMTGLWMSRDAFNAAFSYERVSTTQNKVRSKCEACIMAAIGGRPHALAYLRASMIGRRERHVDQRRPMPRLLRVVESWISHFNAEVRRATMTDSIQISEELDKLDAVIDAWKRERRQRSYQTGVPPRPSRPRESKAYQVDVHSPQGRDSRQSYTTEDSYDSRSPRHSSHFDDDEQQWMDNDETYQASIYLDCQMQRQGLTKAKRREIFENDMHPAVHDYVQDAMQVPVGDRQWRDVESKLESDTTSTFSNSSAIPAPLNLARKHGVPTPPHSNSGDDAAESIWEDVSVFSPPQYAIAGGSTRRHTAAPNTGSDSESLLTTFADNRAHLEFCQKWGLSPGSEIREAPSTQAQTQRDADITSVAAASSVYSDHPGFRRSQKNVAPPPVPPKSRLRDSRNPSNGGQSRASMEQSHRSARDQRDKNIWDELQEDRQRLIREYQDEE